MTKQAVKPRSAVAILRDVADFNGDGMIDNPHAAPARGSTGTAADCRGRGTAQRAQGGYEMTYRSQLLLVNVIWTTSAFVQCAKYGWHRFFSNEWIGQAMIAGWVLCLLFNRPSLKGDADAR